MHILHRLLVSDLRQMKAPEGSQEPARRSRQGPGGQQQRGRRQGKRRSRVSRSEGQASRMGCAQSCHTELHCLQRLPDLAARRAVGRHSAARWVGASRARAPSRRLLQRGWPCGGGPGAAGRQARIPGRACSAAPATHRLAGSGGVAAPQRVGGGRALPPSRTRLVLSNWQVVGCLARGRGCSCCAVALLGLAAIRRHAAGAAKQARQAPWAAAACTLQLGVHALHCCCGAGRLLLIALCAVACG